MNDSTLSRRRALVAGAGLGGLFAASPLVAKGHDDDDDGRRGHGRGDDVEADFTKIWNPDLFFFTLEGKEKPFGKYTAFGELTASTGQGTVVLTDRRGDQIVGFVNATSEAGNRSVSHFQLHWADSVVVGGRTYVNTGAFAISRPQGVVIAIISILIGFLLPPAPRG